MIRKNKESVVAECRRPGVGDRKITRRTGLPIADGGGAGDGGNVGDGTAVPQRCPRPIRLNENCFLVSVRLDKSDCPSRYCFGGVVYLDF